MSDTQLKLTGTVFRIEEPVQVTEKLTKRNFVVTTGDKYPETVAFELINTNCELADAFSEGQQVDVSFNVRGREYNGKFYTNLSAWRIDAAGGAQAAPAAATLPRQNTNPSLRQQPGAQIADPSDEMPF